MPTQSQAHWQVVRPITNLKPAIELALPTHEEFEEDKAQNAKSYIKFWVSGVNTHLSAPHQLLKRQIVITPAIPNISYM